MQEVEFADCKILGVQFQKCNTFLFEISFENCILDFSVFSGINLTKCRFEKSQLHEVDFSGADLSSVSFDMSDLRGALFMKTILTNTDFRTAENYIIDPEYNLIS
jgi:fluoroquinolone resistance protein